MKKYSILFVLFLSVSYSVWAQRTITGTVTDQSNGEGIPLATVLIKGTNNGTAADIEGNYTISNVPEGATLVFSATGFTNREVTVGASNVINVSLTPDIKELEGVVITAMGIERNKKKLPYSVEELKGDQLARKSEGDVIRTMAGKIPGVQIKGSNGAPGASTNIVIRGYGTTQNNQPLFVVDGVPYDNGLFATNNTLISGSAYSNRAVDINPDDIESVTVLKGGSAAALYGSRAAGGVIVITTKSGRRKTGVTQKGLQMTLNSSYAAQLVAKLPNYQNQYGQGAKGIFDNGVFGTWGPAFSELDSVKDFQGRRVPYQAYPDNVRDFYNVGGLLENSITANYAQDKYNISASYANLVQTGIIPNTEFKRNIFSMGGNAQLENGITVGGSLTYTNSDQLGPQTGGGGVADASVHRVLWFVPRSLDLSGYPYQNAVTNQSIYYRPDVLNPYWIVKENPFTSNVNRINGNLNFTANLASWLNASYKFGFNNYTDNRMQVFAKGNPINTQGQIIEDNISFRELESNFILTATKQLSEDFSLRAFVGHNLNQRVTDRQAFSGTNIIAWGIDDLDNTQTVVPFGGGLTERRLIGIFADAEISYKNFLILNLTGRNDWSSTLPKSSRSYFYPSVNTSFIFTDAFKMQNNVLTFGKLRGGWSRVGNDATPYSTSNVFLANSGIGNNLAGIGFPFNGVSVITESNALANPDLKPEFQREFELGTDLEFFKGRIGLNFTYYSRKTTDLITSVDNPATSGYTNRIVNAGTITNKGIEIGLNAKPIDIRDGFVWDISANFTRNRGKVVELAEGLEKLSPPGSRFGSRGQVLKLGLAPFVIEGTKMLRDEQGNLLINPNTGLPLVSTAPEIIGDPNPDFNVGVTNTLSYKSITFSFLIDAQVGGDMYIGTIADLRARGVLEETAQDRDKLFLIQGVLADPNTQQVILQNGVPVQNNVYVDANTYWFQGPLGFASDDASVYDATVVRLRELSLGYQFPKSLLEKTPFGGATVSLTARNLWFYTPNMPRDSSVDPESSGQGAGNLNAMIENYVPNTKSYGVNLRVTF